MNLSLGMKLEGWNRRRAVTSFNERAETNKCVTKNLAERLAARPITEGVVVEHGFVAHPGRANPDHRCQGQGTATVCRAGDCGPFRSAALSKDDQKRTAEERPVLFMRCGWLNGIVKNREALNKLFDELGPRYASRHGGYLRIIKKGFRHGDAAPVSIVELVDRPEAGAQALVCADKPSVCKALPVRYDLRRFRPRD